MKVFFGKRSEEDKGTSKAHEEQYTRPGLKEQEATEAIEGQYSETKSKILK